jgi:cytochrome b subunit of formate dehydrogenase
MRPKPRRKSLRLTISQVLPDAVESRSGQGATFVHDWLAFTLAVVVVGHVYMAMNDPIARLGMRTGWVPTSWARREHGAWTPDVVETDDAETDDAETDDAVRS